MQCILLLSMREDRLDEADTLRARDQGGSNAVSGGVSWRIGREGVCPSCEA